MRAAIDSLKRCGVLYACAFRVAANEGETIIIETVGRLQRGGKPEAYLPRFSDEDRRSSDSLPMALGCYRQSSSIGYYN